MGPRLDMSPRKIWVAFCSPASPIAQHLKQVTAGPDLPMLGATKRGRMTGRLHPTPENRDFLAESEYTFRSWAAVERCRPLKPSPLAYCVGLYCLQRHERVLHLPRQ